MTPATPTRFPPITTRHLLYHVYPVAGNGMWQANVSQLLRRIDLFNGRRIVAVVTDARTDSADSVRAMLADQVDEVIVLSNDPGLREVQTFLPLWERVATTEPGHATFYGHAKAVTQGIGVPWRWTLALYELCLDYWPVVEHALQEKPLAGPFLRDGHNFDPAHTAGRWMYFGSFWWFRNAPLFGQADWRHIDRVWFGIEPYNALHFAWEQAACIFHQGTAPGMDPYEARYFQQRIVPDLKRFRREHAHERTASCTKKP